MNVVRTYILASVAGIPLLVVSASVAAMMGATEVALEMADDPDKVTLVLDWTDAAVIDTTEWDSDGEPSPDVMRRKRVQSVANFWPSMRTIALRTTGCPRQAVRRRHRGHFILVKKQAPGRGRMGHWVSSLAAGGREL